MIRAVRRGPRLHPEGHRALELRAALRSVLTSGYYHTDLVHHTMLNSSMRTEEEKTRAKLLARLTENEVRFLELICDDRETHLRTGGRGDGRAPPHRGRLPGAHLQQAEGAQQRWAWSSPPCATGWWVVALRSHHA